VIDAYKRRHRLELYDQTGVPEVKVIDIFCAHEITITRVWSQIMLRLRFLFV